MISVLVVEDDPAKSDDVRLFIETAPWAEEIEVEFRSSVAGAVEVLKSTRFDLMIVDLMIPTRDGESPKEDGGIQLWKFLRISGDLLHPAYILAFRGFFGRFRAA